MTSRKGDWMQTITGRQFWPLDPKPEEVFIEDIAGALSNLCRYGGHCLRFYSVAEHCVLLSRATETVALDALMHDASEAYLCDVIRPIKHYLGNYVTLEDALQNVIAKRFGLTWPMSREVKRLDDAILADEQSQVMAKPPADWQLPEPPLGIVLQFWTPKRAKVEFLQRFAELT